MSLRIKLNLNFDRNLVFRGFLPESESDALHIDFMGGKYHVTVYLSDRKQLANVSNMPSAVEKHQTFLCTGLIMEVEVVDPEPQIVAALEANQPTEETEAFGKEVFDLVLSTHNGIISYFRNMAKQFWIEPIRPEPRHWQNFLHRWGAVWLDSAGEWRRFHAHRDDGFVIEATIFGGGVDRDAWDRVAAFIERGGQAPMIDVLISNSLKLLDQNNGRLAVVESVIALESAFNRFLAKAVLRLPGTPQIEESQLNKLIEKAGLRIVTKVGLKMIQVQAGLSAEDIETVGEAVEARNGVVHGSRRAIDISLAKNYVSAIRKVIALLEQWATEQRLEP